jgi:serine protease Do
VRFSILASPTAPPPAAKIEAGDLITAINDTPLMNAKDFVPTIAAMAPGTMVYLRIRRDGQLREINLILGSGNAQRVNEDLGIGPSFTHRLSRR